jgi:hypothetical protein
MEASSARPSEILSQISEADLIFVLAGIEARKKYGLRLFHLKRARRILLSVGRFEIRKLSEQDIPVPIDLVSIAAPIPPVQRHYFVSFEDGQVRTQRIPRGRFGTWSEIEALARTLQDRPEIASLIIVSSSQHMQRVRICCRALLPQRLTIQFLASPEEEPGHQTWLGRPRALLTEWFKLSMYVILSWFPKLNDRDRGRPIR